MSYSSENMTRFVLSFIALILWIMSSTDTIHLPSPVQKLLTSPGRTNSHRIYNENQQKFDSLPPTVSGDRLENKKPSSFVENECDVVNKFTSQFTDAILSSEKWFRIFDTSLSPAEAEEAYQRNVFNSVESVHSSYPTAVAKIVSNAIRATFSNLTLTKHVQVYGYTTATFMKSRNILTCENLSKLCDKYLCYVKQAVNNVPDIPDQRDAFIQAAFDGFVHFLTSLNLYTADSVSAIAHDYAHSLYFLTGVPITPPHCDDSNVIDMFTSKFTDRILSSHELSVIYGVYLSPEEAQVAYDRMVFNSVDNINSCYPRTISRTVSKAILATFGNLTLKTHVQTYAHTAARFMKSKNVLTCESLNDLCDAFIYYVKQAVTFLPRIEDKRNAYLQATGDGFVHFLTSLNIFNAESVGELAYDHVYALHHFTGVPRSYKHIKNIHETMYVENFVKAENSENFGSG